VAEATRKVKELAMRVQLENSSVILQLYDNSVNQVGRLGGVRHLPTPDWSGKYHIEGTLQLADKSAIKEMTTLLQPLVKALGNASLQILGKAVMRQRAAPPQLCSPLLSAGSGS
jgi:hypothetical protein